jgi:hypothetical protein
MDSLANGPVLGGVNEISCIEALALGGIDSPGVGPLPPYMRH